MKLWIMLFLPFSLCAISLSNLEQEAVGRRIFMNECSGKQELLVFWNPREPFPSLGIGHFIWFPRNYRGSFTQTWPDLARFLKKNGVILPAFALKKKCPWRSRDEFLADERRRQILTTILSNTLELQTQFLIHQFEKTRINMCAQCTQQEQSHINRMVCVLEATAQGMFALIDYLNFKGEGTNPAEQYQEKGWGLTQVLLAMPPETTEHTAVENFITAAQQCLEQRVENAPFEKPDAQFLPGWLARISRYRQQL